MENTRALPTINISARPRDFSRSRGRALATSFALGACTYLIARLLGVASRLTIEYYDGYQTLLDARALASRAPMFYNFHRPIGLTLLYLPFHLVDASAWRSVHVFSVGLVSLLGVTGFALFRRAMSAPFAAVATLTMLWNPLVVHYAPFASPDLAATLFVTAALLCHARENFTGECLAVLAAVSVRYPLLAFLPLYFAISHAVAGRRAHAVGALVIPPSLLVAIAALVDSALGRPATGFVGDLFTQYAYNGAHGARPASFALWFSARLLPPVLLVAAATGVARHARLALFAAGFLVVNAFLVPGKEMRYFLPLLPALAMLAGIGAERLWHALPRVARLYLLALVALPLVAGTRELARFADPVYTDDFVDRLAAAITARAPDGALYWIGPLYPLHPARFNDTPLDDYTHLHHISADALIWRTNRPVRELPVDAISRVVRDGDAVVVNHEPESYVTRNLPTRALAPLVVQAVKNGGFTDAILVKSR